MNWKEKWEDISFEIWYRWNQMTNWFYDVYYFFRNIKLFWKDLKDYRDWDHHHCVDIYCTALAALKENIYRNGNEVDSMRMKKVEAMEELLNLLQYDEEDVIWSTSEHKKDTISLVAEAQKAKKKRIFEILNGQDPDELSKMFHKREKDLEKFLKKHPLLYFDKYDTGYDECTADFDGTGCDGWWD